MIRAIVATPIYVVILGATFVGAANAQPDAGAAGILRADFRGKPIDDKLFEKFGAKGQIRTEPEGLRMTLPRPDGTAPDTGIQARFKIKGDFDIIASFELIAAENPARAFCIGVTLHARMDDKAETSPFMGRFNRQDGPLYTCDLGRFTEFGKRDIQERLFPSEAKSGRLCLSRRGPIVTYLVADVGSDKFEALTDWETGTADVKALRLQVENKKSNAPVDVRFLDLEIRSGDSVSKDGLPLISNASRRMFTGGWLVAAEISGLVGLLLLLILVRRWLRNRNRAATVVVNSQPEGRA